MTETLRGLGFEVIERLDANQKEMKLAIFELGALLEEAGKEAVGLFYYAGHGVQVNGRNFLIPLKAEIKRETHVTVEAVDASWVLGEMEFAGNRVNFVILDACRNNPLTRSFRSQVRGLAKMSAPTGSLVAYSTAPGDVAVDGEGANSPYTLALSQAMQTPNLPAEKVFKLVRNSVREATNNEQTPWEESSMTGSDFYFSLNVSIAIETPGTATPSITESAATTQQETVFWQSVKDSADPGMFEAYLQNYPNGAFANIAKLKRDALLGAGKPEAQAEPVVPRVNLDLAFWESIEDSDNPADYQAYLQKFPDGEFAVLARLRIDTPEQDRSYASIGGNYLAEGRNPDGSTYSGSCRVTNIGEGNFSFHWSIGNQSFSGTGKLIGDTISVDWGAASPVIYKVAADGTLNGIWSNGQAVETLRPRN